ncbi:hypothetical protein SPYJRS4_0274 [Streptococcus pyogenes JRS4]|uniref:Uncharacterized protein n=1 Tax=Streptococcus pyogenes serotype M12 (strain MGAS9429) TaxID=370551 RepID=Q1JND0_STRPC|nr:hypothetical protein MGAS9429_Spy0281 [Streptococcus pyogenes MGAS9429]BAR43774.1 hypothetical protein SPYJRS4_0274 [Streptococcus pyogenes JRS4]
MKKQLFFDILFREYGYLSKVEGILTIEGKEGNDY